MAENITNSNKVLDKFSSATNIITAALLENFREVTHLQADFYTCSSNTSRIASIDISSSSATTYSDERLGDDLPSNQSAQVPAESPLISASRPSDKFKNNSFSAVKSMSIYADFASFDAIVREALRHAFNFSVQRLQQISNYLSRCYFSLVSFPLQAFPFLVGKSNMVNLRCFTPCHIDNRDTLSYNISITETRPLLPSNSRVESGQVSSFRTDETTNDCNTLLGHCVTPSFTVPFYADMGGEVMQDYLTQIPAGREGYIYLIHAEGTNRYKIGRSVNPIARHETLKNQSPYPLTIIDCFWTIDAVKDESSLHKKLSDHRVRGEWFEFEDDGGMPWRINNPIKNRVLALAFENPASQTEFSQKIYGCISKSLNKDILARRGGYELDPFSGTYFAVRDLIRQADSLKSYQFIDWLFGDPFAHYVEKDYLCEVDEPCQDSYICGFIQSARASMWWWSSKEAK